MFFQTVCLFVFQDWVSLHSPDSPGTCSVDQAGFELRSPCTSAYAEIKAVNHYSPVSLPSECSLSIKCILSNLHVFFLPCIFFLTCICIIVCMHMHAYESQKPKPQVATSGMLFTFFKTGSVICLQLSQVG